MHRTDLLPNDAALAARYEDDFYLWVAHQVALLREKKFSELDVANLIEEMDGMSASARAALGHRLETLILHLLKCRYQPEKISTGWIGTIGEQRARIHYLIQASPSLARQVQSYADKCYARAVKRAAEETHLPRSTFPLTNPYSADQLLGDAPIDDQAASSKNSG